VIRQALLLATVVLGSAVSAMAQVTPVARLVGPFLETIRSEAPVSGGDVLGLVVVGDRLPHDAEKIFVRHSSGRAASVCVEMVTRDGRYVASGTFELPVTAPGEYVLIPIAERTRYTSILRAAVLQDFAVRARVGRCDQAGGALIPTAWSAPPPPAGGMRLAVTVQGANSRTFLRVPPALQTTPVSCTRIYESRHTAFDSYCVLSVPTGVTSPFKVQVERCTYGECTRSPAIEIGL
jgi:hypothetical protein